MALGLCPAASACSNASAFWATFLRSLSPVSGLPLGFFRAGGTWPYVQPWR